MKTKSRILTGLLSVLLLAALLGLPALPVYAADEYVVTAADTIQTLQAAADAGSALHFPAGTYVFDGTLAVGPNTATAAAQNITLTTDAGADVTFKPAAGNAGITVAGGCTATFAGSGTITIDDANSTSGIARGIDCAGNLAITGGTLNVKDTPGYGIGGDAQGDHFSMTGGVLNITHCGWAGDEGGFIWSKHGSTCDFTAGELNILDCGNTMFGSLYTECPTTFGGAAGAPAMKATLRNSAAGAAENTIFFTQTMTVNPSASVSVVLTGSTGTRRGINTAGGDVVIAGGVFHVTNEYTGTGATYGIRGADVTVKNGGVLQVDAATYGVGLRFSFSGIDGTFTASGNSLVTLSSAGTGASDSSELSNTITGGSVKMQGSGSVISGRMVPAAGKVTPQPVNAAGELLTRFDLPGMAGKSIAIAADPANAAAHPAYSYSIGADHGGTAYVWAPAVTVKFWPSVLDYTGGDAARLLLTDYTIRGSTIAAVGGSAPDTSLLTPPAGTKFLCWVNAATGEVFDPAAAVISANTDVYAAYAVTSAQNVPIDVMEDSGDGTTFINGPRDAAAGDAVYYKMTIDMSEIANIAASYGTSTGLLTGHYKMTVAAGTGLQVNTGAGASDKITDYFAGDAVQLFELTGKPVYDAAANTFTVEAKVRDEYAVSGITGTELARLLNAGLYAVSTGSNTAIITNDIRTPGYARARITFSGEINYSNRTHDKNYSISLTGVQKTPDVLGDPTLAAYGSDPAETVSATVLYKARQYRVNYQFVSGTGGKTLPAEVTALLPAAAQAADGTAVTAAQPARTTAAVSGGTWTFAGYDAAGKTIQGADITFTGTWTFAASTPAATEAPTPAPAASTASSTANPPAGTAAGAQPRTADTRPLSAWLLMLALSSLGCAGVLFAHALRRTR